AKRREAARVRLLPRFRENAPAPSPLRVHLGSRGVHRLCRGRGRLVLEGGLMRFGIEAGSWVNPRGFGRFLRALYGELARRRRNEWVLAMDAPTARAANLPDATPRQVIATDWAAGQGAAAGHRRSMREMLRMS